MLALVAHGHSNGEIAAALGRSESTISIHGSNILEKPKVGDRTAAVTVALRRGYLRLKGVTSWTVHANTSPHSRA